MAGMVVPRLEGPTVQNAAVSTPQAQASGADAFGAGIGKGLSTMGNVGLEIAKQEQEKADAAIGDRAKGEALSLYNRLSVEAQAVTGRGVDPGYTEDGEEQAGAPGLTEQYLAEFKEKLPEITKGMNSRQLAKFQPFITDHVSGLERTLLTHEISQRETYQKAQSAATAKLQVDQLVQAPDEKTFAAGVARLDETLGHIFQGDVLEEKRKELLDGVQKQRVVNAITRGDTKGARSIFEVAGFNPKSEEYADLKHRLDGAEAADLGESFVAGIWKQPTNNASVTDLPKMYQALDEAVQKGTLSREAGRIAEAELSQRVTRYEQARSVALHTFTSDVWQGIDDKKLNLKQALAKVDAAAMPGDQRVQLKKSIEIYFKPPPADPEAKMMQKLEQDSALADLMLKINNGEVRIKTLKDAQAYTGLVGRANVTRLAGYAQKYEGALANPNLTGRQFDQVIDELRGAGVDLPEKKKGSKANPAYLAMQATMLDEIVSKQTKTGKILDDEGVKQEFRRMATEKLPVNSRQTFAGIPLWQTTDQKRAWEVQNPAAVDIAGLLETKLKRKPTAAEVAAATAAYNRKNPSRQVVKARTRFGGIE